MTSLLLILICLLIMTGLFSFYFYKSRILSDYKELFELADIEYKKSQEKIQQMIEKLGNQDLVMERASQALELSNKKAAEQYQIIQVLDEKLRFQESQYSKLLSQKKSSEVRTGKIAEQISPFLSDYPLDPNTARFIGDPIDFIHFDKDSINFVEVKSGKSQLSKKQRMIRDMIKDGKVNFILYRVEGEEK